jgi:hypothetical protein
MPQIETEVSTEKSRLGHRTIREGKNSRRRKRCAYLDLDGGVFIWIKACTAAVEEAAGGEVESGGSRGCGVEESGRGGL